MEMASSMTVRGRGSGRGGGHGSGRGRGRGLRLRLHRLGSSTAQGAGSSAVSAVGNPRARLLLNFCCAYATPHATLPCPAALPAGLAGMELPPGLQLPS